MFSFMQPVAKQYCSGKFISKVCNIEVILAKIFSTLGILIFVQVANNVVHRCVTLLYKNSFVDLLLKRVSLATNIKTAIPF